MRKRDEPYRWAELATYNAERARGLVHTEEWQERMLAQQIEFKAEQQAVLVTEATEKGYVVLNLRGGGALVGPADVVHEVAQRIESGR